MRFSGSSGASGRNRDASILGLLVPSFVYGGTIIIDRLTRHLFGRSFTASGAIGNTIGLVALGAGFLAPVLTLIAGLTFARALVRKEVSHSGRWLLTLLLMLSVAAAVHFLLAFVIGV